MAKQFSNYQKQVIKNYYNNLDNIALSRLSELVGNLYLADSAKKADKLWQQVASAMEKLKIPKSVAEHIMKMRSVEILAKNFNEWQKK